MGVRSANNDRARVAVKYASTTQYYVHSGRAFFLEIFSHRAEIPLSGDFVCRTRPVDCFALWERESSNLVFKGIFRIWARKHCDTDFIDETRERGAFDGRRRHDRKPRVGPARH